MHKYIEIHIDLHMHIHRSTYAIQQMHTLMRVGLYLHRTAVGGDGCESDDVREVDGRLIVVFRLNKIPRFQLLSHLTTGPTTPIQT